LDGFAMEGVGIFYGLKVYFMHGRLVYFMAIWYIFGHFGIFYPFWYPVPRKICQPWSETVTLATGSLFFQTKFRKT
jgi:hypothetical protein